MKIKVRPRFLVLSLRALRTAVPAAVLAALCASGLQAQWAKAFAASNLQFEGYAQCLIEAHGGGYIVGGEIGYDHSGSDDYDGEMAILRIDEEGRLVWAKTYSTDGCSVSRLISVPDGYVAFAKLPGYEGGFNSLFKIDENGEVVWARGNLPDDASDIIPLKGGGYMAFGYYATKLDDTGHIVWRKRWVAGADPFYLAELRATPDGGFIAAGELKDEACLAKFDAEGTLIWSVKFGGPYNDDAKNVVATNDGGYLVTGATYDPSPGSSYWLAKFDGSGALEWRKVYTTGILDILGTGAGGYDIWSGAKIAEIDAFGNIQWGRVFEGSEYAPSISTVSRTSNGELIVAGATAYAKSNRLDFSVIKIGAGPSACLPFSASAITVTEGSFNSAPAALTEVAGSWTFDHDAVGRAETLGVEEITLCDKGGSGGSGPSYSVTIRVDGGGTTIPAPGSHSYSSGTAISVEAVPFADYEFVGWTITPGPLPSVQNPLSLRIDKSYGLTARFQRIIYAPLNVRGQRVRSSWSGYFDILTWESPDSPSDIAAYRVYEIQAGGEVRVGETPARAGTNAFIRRGVRTNEVSRYVIRAVNQEGREGRPGGVSVSLSLRPLRRIRIP